MDTYDPHKSTTEVRQGNPQKTNSRVLIIALTTVIIAFAIIWAVYAMWPEGGTPT